MAREIVMLELVGVMALPTSVQLAVAKLVVYWI
jgi:hypothetical protein